MAAFLSVLPKQQQNRTQPTQELDDLAQTHRRRVAFEALFEFLFASPFPTYRN